LEPQYRAIDARVHGTCPVDQMRAIWAIKTAQLRAPAPIAMAIPRAGLMPSGAGTSWGGRSVPRTRPSKWEGSQRRRAAVPR
jgi:hypothetical protein